MPCVQEQKAQSESERELKKQTRRKEREREEGKECHRLSQHLKNEELKKSTHNESE